MRELYKLCRASNRSFKEFPNGSHNDTVAEPGYFQHFADFINKQVLNE